MAPFGRWDSRSGRREHSTAAGRPDTRGATTQARRCRALPRLGKCGIPRRECGRRRDCQDDRLRRRPRSHGRPPGAGRRTSRDTRSSRRCSTVPREDFVPEALRPVAYLGEHVPLAPGRVLLDPRVFAKLLDALAVEPERPGPRPRLRPRLLDRGAGADGRGGGRARVRRRRWPPRPRRGSRRTRSTTPWSQTGPLAEGVAEHGPFDAILVEGAIEMLPEALAAQLKPGGRIAAILVEGARGQARLGLRAGDGIAWRRIFDATAPVLPGFEATKAFEF